MVNWSSSYFPINHLITAALEKSRQAENDSGFKKHSNKKKAEKADNYFHLLQAGMEGGTQTFRWWRDASVAALAKSQKSSEGWILTMLMKIYKDLKPFHSISQSAIWQNVCWYNSNNRVNMKIWLWLVTHWTAVISYTVRLAIMTFKDKRKGINEQLFMFSWLWGKCAQGPFSKCNSRRT